MNKLIFIFGLFPLFLSAQTSLHLADPTIFEYNDEYFLYGTVERNTSEGFLVYRSKDLKNWKLSTLHHGYALRKGEAFGTKGFWAPQVFRYKKSFFMAYTAEEQIAIAQSNSPLGPFVQTKPVALTSPVKQIDPYVFVDDDGKAYLYHVRLDKGNRIFVAEMNADLSAILPATLKECIEADARWENTASARWPVTEGPTVLKREGIYYLFYSANDFKNPDYAVGYATAPHPLGPWTKFNGNPILNTKMIGENGTGHGDFFYANNRLTYVFHTHFSKDKALPRKTAVISARFLQASPDSVKINPRSFRFLKAPKP